MALKLENKSDAKSEFVRIVAFAVAIYMAAMFLFVWMFPQTDTGSVEYVLMGASLILAVILSKLWKYVRDKKR
ncbi:MAG: hypothetical protein M3436_17030 [Pseudomonadota bacterium]|nr:hypothetical protein [Pseudomonadota bacterium]